ncbi:hypothetical protein AALP_AA4G267200 [Arabis alpina]|uniref:beta-glucosidase n=1 Tax=Arabis alpina TaxID=50452 RepID=A0A087H5W3_ARAAL|nr:hypothetical protein AALP_AA4G267200 [Arabis alpina]
MNPVTESGPLSQEDRVATPTIRSATPGPVQQTPVALATEKLYRKKYKDRQGGSIGYSIFGQWFIPSTNSKDEEITIQRARDFYLGWMLEPLIYGNYPDVMKRTVGSRLPVFTEEESELVKGSADFLGINYYFAATVTKNEPSSSRNPDYYTDMGLSMTLLANFSSSEYDVIPWAMEGVLDYIKQSYGNPPIYILENGTPAKGDLPLELKDTRRIEYLDAYMGAVLNAVRNGSDTRGYFVWSFMDVYELNDFSFGMYNVNFSDPQLKRSPKLSAHWYSAFLKGNNNTFFVSQGMTQLQTNSSSSTSSL